MERSSNGVTAKRLRREDEGEDGDDEEEEGGSKERISPPHPFREHCPTRCRTKD
jgi:hypothetical protein